MPYKERLSIIKKLEEKRKSKIITLVISDRKATANFLGINATIAPDQVEQITEQLKLFETKGISLDKIELLIYSRGGDTNTAWILVNTIRNYAKEFNVLIPLYSHSAATLISLGANNIVMCKTASLSPIDPTVANAFNPKENGVSQGISVEDVTSFMALAKDKDRVGIKGQQYITEAFKILAEKVHPLALGNVKRSHTQIRILGRKLLELHFEKSEQLINGIIDSLTEKFYTHYHLIFRDEAKKMGLSNIKHADLEEEKLLWEIYKDYEEELKLKDIFDINIFLKDKTEDTLETQTAFIETTEKSCSFKIKQVLKKALNPDINHRLQVTAQTHQFVLNIGTMRNQLSQIILGLTQINAQLAQNAALAPIQGSNQQIINNLAQIVGNTPPQMDLSDLRINIESKLLEIGWV